MQMEEEQRARNKAERELQRALEEKKRLQSQLEKMAGYVPADSAAADDSAAASIAADDHVSAVAGSASPAPDRRVAGRVLLGLEGFKSVLWVVFPGVWGVWIPRLCD